MKKRIIKVLFLFVLCLMIAGCKKEDVPAAKTVNIALSQSSVELSVTEALEHDYTKYFIITVDNEIVETNKSYLDLTSLKDEVGSYIVTCTYEKKIQSIIVNVVTSTNINVSSDCEIVEVDNLNVYSHDYTQYFNIEENGNVVKVTSEYLDLSSLRANEGTYKVTCTYKGMSSSIIVNVKEITYQIKLPETEITLKQKDVKDYDFNSLFTVVVNGKIQTITSDMVVSNVKEEIGTYSYTVKLGETQMTLKVNVISNHEIEIVNSYNICEIELSNVLTYDYTKLFSIYVDGATRDVTSDMIDITSLNDCSVNETYKVKVSYSEGGATASGECLVKVVEDAIAQITSKDITTYPNGDYIELTSLFEIKLNGQTIEVTPEMITGSIDYSKVGDNIITLTYLNQTKQATVHVKQGVIINFPNGEVVEIGKGTNINSYDFTKDFSVKINGIEYSDISSYIDYSKLDINTPGDYEVSINIPYTDSSLSIAKNTIFTETITYRVLETLYDIKISQDLVTLPKGTKEYNVFNNLSLKVNGVNQKLVSSTFQVGAISKYAVLTSTPIDFTSIAVQDVEVAIYVYGVDKDPVTVSYKVRVESDIEIKSKNLIIFENTSIRTIDLFEIYYNQEKIEVTQDMISGKVGMSCGVYEVTLNYLGLEAKATVVILNKEMIGTYKTTLSTIKKASTEDEEGYTIEGSNQRVLGDLHITEDGQISFNGKLYEIVEAIDENTLLLKNSANLFTMYYNKGIIFIDPNNNIRLQFHDDKRPLIYFDESKYEILSHITINSTGSYVLENSITSYSFDIFEIKDKDTNVISYYGLKVNLYEKTSNDTNYIVNCGEVVFEEGYDFSLETQSSFTYLQESYRFSLSSSSLGSITKPTSNTYKYANMVFNGYYNGSSAQVKIDQYEGVQLVVNGDIVFSVGGASIRDQKYGGYDYSLDQVLIAQTGYVQESPISCLISFNLENMTFEIFEKDHLYGKYQSEKMEVFFDGYGGGLINFDITQYGKTSFVYQILANEIKITYTNTNPSFKYGTYASFYIDDLGSTLTLKYLEVEGFEKEILINRHIQDGAIISISSYSLKQYSSVVLGRKALFDLIQIETKDGIITDNKTKITMVDISDIDFAVCGFYHFSITVNVNGVDKVMHYALQITQ